MFQSLRKGLVLTDQLMLLQLMLLQLMVSIPEKRGSPYGLLKYQQDVVENIRFNP